MDSQTMLLNSKKLCRTCMSSETELTSLAAFVTISQKQESLIYILFKCTSIQVEENDGLPQELCNNCVEKLMICHLYRELSLDTQNRLQQLYQQCDSVTPTYPCLNCDIPQPNNESEKVSGTLDTIENLGSNTIIQTPPEFIEDFDCKSEYNIEDFDCKSEYFDCYNPNSNLGCDTQETENNISDLNKNEEEPDQKLSCFVCSKQFESKYNMRRHMKVHLNCEELKCKICMKQFTRATDVKRHMSVHTGSKPFLCTICNASFTQSGTLVMHKRKHDGSQEVKTRKKSSERMAHLCSICGKAFKQSSSLTLHVRRHLGDKPYNCKVCNMKFVSSGRLTSHMRVHTGERPFECNICGKRFAQSSVAAKHTKAHMDYKPHKCGCCPKSFSTLYYLNIHKRQHTGEKPHECTQCDKSFADPKNLKQHKKVHSNEKPFLCIICGKPFRRSHHLKSHMNIHAKGRVC